MITKIKNHKIILISFFLLIILLLFIFTGERLNITFVKNVKANIQWGEIPGNWFVITHKDQYDNWVKDGLDLPDVDFNHNFIIVSKVKIYSLFKSRLLNNDCGAYDGIAIYNPLSSKMNKYYIYKMDKVWLSQGIG